MASAIKHPTSEIAISNNVTKFCGSCFWSIYDYSFSVGNEHHSPIISPTFAVGPRNELKWHLKLYPMGFDADHRDYVGLSVGIFETSDYKEILANCEIAIYVDDSEDVINKVKTASLHNFKEKWVIKDFIKRDYFINIENRLLIDDRFTLYCKIDANACYEISEEDVSYTYYLYKSKLKVSQDLKLLMNGILTDVLFLVDTETLYLHKAVLSSRSNVFDAMFKHKMSERENNVVYIGDISFEAFHKMIQYIYSGVIDDIGKSSQKILIELFMAADKYELTDLKDLCELVFFNDLNFDNALEMLIFADDHNANRLKSQIIQFIAAHNKQFVHERVFETFSETHSHLLPLLIKESTNLEGYLDDWFWDSLDIEEEPPVDKILIEGKSWGITQLCIDKFSYTWKIDNLSFFLKTESLRESILDQDFSQDKFTWQLSLCSESVYEHDQKKDYVSLYLQLFYGIDQTKEIQAQYEFIALDNEGNQIKSVKSDILRFIANGERLGEKQFFTKSFLFAHLSENSDSLTIVCNITSSMNKNKGICQVEPMNCDVAKYQLGISRDFQYFLEDEKFHDFSIIVDKKKFNLHRAILAVRCPALLAVLNLHLEMKGKIVNTEGKPTVEIKDIAVDVLEQLLIFIYCGYVNELSKFAKDLFIESKKYELSNLQSICESFLMDYLDIVNACDNFVFASLHNASKLRSKTILFITHNLDSVIKTSGYKSLAESRPRLLKDILCKL